MNQYKVKFNLINATENEIGSKNMSRLIDEFVELRGIFVDDVNPLYEIWNKEYKDPISGDDDEAYNAYIREKHEPYIRKANAIAKERNYIIRLAVRSDIDICGIFKIKGKDEPVKIFITLVPM